MCLLSLHVSLVMCPEIDSPGHSASWQLGYPEVGVQVPDDWYSGMVDPTKNASFELLGGLFGELAELFEDEYVHIGCDEVPLSKKRATSMMHIYMCFSILAPSAVSLAFSVRH